MNVISTQYLVQPLPASVLPKWDLSVPAGGGESDRASPIIQLDNGYRLEVDAARAEIRIVNSGSGETTTIYDGSGEGKGRGPGGGTFILADGTRITVGAPSSDECGTGLPGSLAVTRGERSMIVDGLAQAGPGELRVHRGMNGQALDRLLAGTGPVAHENANGIGWTVARGACPPAARECEPVSNQPPRRPDLSSRLDHMYFGDLRSHRSHADCATPTTPAAGHGKHGYGGGHGKHGYGVGHGKHGYGVGHGKHGYGVGHGKHGYGVGHGKHGYGVGHGKHGGAIDYGKHGYGVGHGKHGACGMYAVPSAYGACAPTASYGKHGSHGGYGHPVGRGKHC
jgi:hypothetical protein